MRSGINLVRHPGTVWAAPVTGGGGGVPAGFAAAGDFPTLATAAGTRAVKHRDSPYGRPAAQVDVSGTSACPAMPETVVASPVIDLTAQGRTEQAAAEAAAAAQAAQAGHSQQQLFPPQPGEPQAVIEQQQLQILQQCHQLQQQQQAQAMNLAMIGQMDSSGIAAAQAVAAAEAEALRQMGSC